MLIGNQEDKSSSDAIRAAMEVIKSTSIGISINAIAATIVFCMLVAQTIGLLITYINRMLKLAFLIIISPLITLTYSMDKMGDGKAQALGTWLKEFIYTILIQPFHCVIYMSFLSMAISILTSADVQNNLAGAIIAILCVKFTKEGEKLLGKIFKFGEHTSDTSLAVGMAASAMALSKAKSVGKGTRKAVNGIKGIRGRTRGALTNAKVEGMAAIAFLRRAKNEDGSRMTFEQAKDEANTKVTNKKADKLLKKNASKYNVKETDTECAKKIDERAEQLAAGGKMTEKLARATARAEIARETRKEKKKERSAERDNKHKVLRAPIRAFKSVRGTIKDVTTIARESETLKDLNNMRKGIVAAGLGSFAGSATYGASGNLANSVALGMASYRGANEFMQASGKTLKDSSEKLLQGMGIKNDVQAANKLEEVKANPILGDNQELQNYLNELLEFVDSVITEASKAKHIKNSIKSTVAKEIKKDPTASIDDIMRKLKANDSIKPDFDKLENNGLRDAVQNVATTQREKELYDNIQSASDIGFDPSYFAKTVSKRFKGNQIDDSEITSTSNNVSEQGHQTNDNTEQNKEGELNDDIKQIEQDKERELDDKIKQVEHTIEKEGKKQEEHYFRELESIINDIKKIKEDLHKTSEERLDNWYGEHSTQKDIDLMHKEIRLKNELMAKELMLQEKNRLTSTMNEPVKRYDNSSSDTKNDNTDE